MVLWAFPRSFQIRYSGFFKNHNSASLYLSMFAFFPSSKFQFPKQDYYIIPPTVFSLPLFLHVLPLLPICVNLELINLQLIFNYHHFFMLSLLHHIH